MQTLTTVLLYFLLGNRFGYAYRTGTGYISIDCGNNQPDNETMKSDSEYIDTGTNVEIMNPNTLQSSDYFDAEPLKTLRSFPDGKRNCYSIKPENGMGSKYLIRARFLYGNYDTFNVTPIFDLYIGVDFWDTILNGNMMTEIIYKPVSNLIHVCLVNTGQGTPFISDLVLRPVRSSLYESGSGSLKTVRRYDAGQKLSNVNYHSYEHDILDRYWKELPRENFENWTTTKSTTSEALRKLKEMDAIMDVKEKYQDQIKGWGGDPCLPIIPWHGLNCSISSNDSQRIVSLDLSHMNLTGPILPSLFQLTSLNSLNLSYNYLTGEIPEDLGEMQNLQYIDLSGNLLSGKVPIKLLEKKQSGSIITLRYDGNVNLCTSKACMMKKKPKYLVPLITVGILSLLLIAGAILCLRKWKTEEGSDRSSRLNPKNRQFTESEMANITNNYSTALGQGGFAIVYLGTLSDTQVAVKLLNQNSTLTIFQSEAELLMRVYHKNLVSLVGYCDAGNTMALVYEYMANGDLKKYLSAEQTNISSWKQRLRIAVDIAQGLEYLHYGCKPPIIHRDIKPANILLDDNLNAKISDFGLSRMFPSEGDNDTTKSYLVGTRGYMDPDNGGGRLNEKSDVFSFGVILLELITGKPAIQTRGENEPKIHVIDWVKSVLSNDGADIRSILDQRFNGYYSIESVKKAVEIARECVRLIGIQRPDMTVVMNELKLSLAIENEQNPRSIIQLHYASSSTSSNAIFDIEQAHQQF